jgi:hypothetical protein
LYAEIIPVISVASYFSISDGTLSNRIAIGFEANSGLLRVFGNTGSMSGGSFSTGQVIKIAVGYQSGSSALYANGVLLSSQSTAFIALFNRISFDSGGGTQPFNGRIRSLALYPTRIPNTAPLGVLSLQSLTQ